MREHWKPVKNSQGAFEVSSLGRVRSVERRIQVRRTRWGSPTTRSVAAKVLSPVPDKDGYLRVCMRGVRNGASVHRAVAEAFLPNPEGKPQVNHKNGDKTDNTVMNLEWCTASENHLHAFRELGRQPNSPEPRPVVLTGGDGKEKKFPSPRAAAEFLGVVDSAVRNALCQGTKTKGHEVRYV